MEARRKNLLKKEGGPPYKANISKLTLGSFHRTSPVFCPFLLIPNEPPEETERKAWVSSLLN